MLHTTLCEVINGRTHQHMHGKTKTIMTDDMTWFPKESVPSLRKHQDTLGYHSWGRKGKGENLSNMFVR